MQNVSQKLPQNAGHEEGGGEDGDAERVDCKMQSLCNSRKIQVRKE